MTAIQQAIKNITIVVGNTRMTGQEHDQLKQDIMLVAQRCKQADELEQESKKEAKEPKKEAE